MILIGLLNICIDERLILGWRDVEKISWGKWFIIVCNFLGSDFWNMLENE